ncbi:uncharacterized protein LOC121871375 [Homarus americanus]|uniref:uncharacterized protein LOC121871375 n=1 Tax=Homarus americanus TaxID=6706 RepID=UPI001C4455DE|nr:uncharacterized protein LOC121871375 [Homarus americanus]
MDGVAAKCRSWLALRWLVVAAVLITAWMTVATSGSHFSFTRSRDLGGSKPIEEHCLSQDTRRRLAASLTKIQRLMSGGQSGSDEVGRWSREVGRVVAELDPRLARENLRPPTLVCSDHHNGTKFLVNNCKGVPRLAQVVSVVVPARGWQPSRVSQVLHGLAAHHNLTTILILADDDPTPDTNGMTLVQRYDHAVSDGKALNDAIALVNTSFVLVATSLAHYSWLHSPLERLVRVLDRLGGEGVAGGSYRDEQGQWRHGCLQRSITNYHATFLRGYQHSILECMYCDEVLGPFLASTHLLQQHPFPDEVSGPALYREWHTKVTQAGYLTLACPDVMFFLQEEPIMNTADWNTYATRMSIQTIHSYDGKEYKFKCSDVHIKCDDLRKTITWYLIPLCCREAIMHGITILDDFAREKGLLYEMSHGSLLGAVKLGTYLPWDFDQDIYYDCKDRRIWETINEFLKARNTGCHLRVSNDRKLLVLQCTTFFVDMPCRKPLSSHTLPAVYRNVTTWIDYGGRRVSVMANPGSAARDQAGPDNLRHAQHWRVPGHPDPGAWRPCQNPTDQACLDHHPADGSLAFTSPPMCLP